MRNLTLNSKILLLLISSILMVLILVGLIFSVQITQLHERSSRIELGNSTDLVRADLIEKKQQLSSVSHRLVQDENILATLNLIYRYQDSAKYQPLVFDPEKKNLSKTLQELLHAGDLSMVSVYEADGDLIAFQASTEKGAAGGYQTYNNNQAVLVPLNPDEDDDYSLMIYQSFGKLERGQEGGEAIIQFREGADKTTLIMDSVTPFSVQQSETDDLILGWLRLSYNLDMAYLTAMSQKLNVDVAIVIGDSYIASEGFIPNPSAYMSIPVPELKVEEGARNEIGWIAVEGGFEAHMTLPIDGDEHVHLVLGEGASDLANNLNVFARSVFWVLLLSGVLVAPLGVYFSRRWISTPIRTLTGVAEAITQGKRPRVAGFDQHDELGVLADAFVVMSSAIMNRENELRDKQRQIEGIIGNAPAVIYIKNRDGTYQLINSLYEKLFSVTNEQMVGNTDSLLFEPDVAALIRANEEVVFATLKPVQIEEVIPHGDGLHTYLSIKFPLFDDDHNVIAVCGISTDITERKRIENDLLLAKNIVENANEGVVVTTLDNIIVDVNDAYERISGYTREEVLGKTPVINQSGRHDEEFYKEMWDSIRSLGYWQGEIWDRRKNGEVYPKWLSINTVRDDAGMPTHYVGVFSDITSKKATEKQLEKLAYFDALTNLPNRLLFRDRLNQEISSARRHGNKVALLFLDLDRFKSVNDTLGHAAGDELLQMVSHQLTRCVRESDTVSRLGGDEFTIIIPEVEHEDQLSGVAQKIIDQLAQPMELLGHEVHIGTSVGIAIFPNDGDDLDSLSQHADMALYKAKDEGRNNFQFFSSELQTHISERMAMEDDLRKGLPANEFLLHYQPKYNLSTNTLSGMETLVRWQQPVRGMVSPADFIPLAEETGLIIPLGEYILREACRQTAEWKSITGLSMKVAVNLSARQFRQKDLIDTVRGILDESGLPAESLELELTESMVMGDVEEDILTMRALRDIGLSLAIDDFGTGYSSLSYLKRFPINTLKIDQSFVRDLTTDSDDASIVQAIIAMGRQLDLHVVAEGVETQEQLDFLREHGCEEVQGYFMSKPLSSEQFAKLITS